ncbi:hypothetical protein CWB41_04155 [Methylovirgula ligni]|uniref:Uncharacterized protein n=1 Tax=Methylovirgula ligni TaxID=569860 RepID=A0A3D9YPQ9_9HYPH|nr:hypothetical protein CWB41_04155 [Methylovirgula ligni]REF84514.1 hypothetical protein DES32_2621 [Methylovirgula ligni]
MPNSKSEISTAKDRNILEAIYALEDARIAAEHADDRTLRYFIEMALTYAKNAVKTVQGPIDRSK